MIFTIIDYLLISIFTIIVFYLFFNDSCHAFVIYQLSCVAKDNFTLTMFEIDTEGILFFILCKLPD